MRNVVVRELMNRADMIKNSAAEYADLITAIVDEVVETYKSGGKVVLCGNGGCATVVNHVSAELVGRFGSDRPPLKCLSLCSNSAVLTALANDYGYENVFSRQIEAIVDENDLVWFMSTSGSSKNIINGILTSRRQKAKVIGFTGKRGGDMKTIVDLLVNASSNNAAIIEEFHLTVGHIICTLVDQAFSQADRHAE
jgi:D-sedoheptulose 7-phosphate isomerase